MGKFTLLHTTSERLTDLQIQRLSSNFTRINLDFAMKKFIVPIVLILGYFLFMFAVLASTDRTTAIALFGAN